jgi:hypothetical protein
MSRSILAAQIIQGYFYQNPLAKEISVTASSDTFNIADSIELTSGGYGGFLVNGVV